MEYTNHSLSGCNSLLSFQWNTTTERYRHRFSIIWQGNILSVKVHSACQGVITGRLTDIDFKFNHESHHIKLIDSPYHKGKRGDVPDFKGSTHRLVIRLTRESFHLYEKPLEAHEIPQRISNPFQSVSKHLDKPVEIKINKSSEYDFLPRRGESWIMVSDMLETSEWKVAVPLKSAILWVKRIHAEDVNPNVTLFRYEFFSKGIRPIELKMNGFVCTKAYDASKKTSNGVRCTILFKVTDRNGECRVVDIRSQGREGMVNFLRYMVELSKRQDWEDADAMKELTAGLGITVDKIDEMLRNDLEGTGTSIDVK